MRDTALRWAVNNLSSWQIHLPRAEHIFYPIPYTPLHLLGYLCLVSSPSTKRYILWHVLWQYPIIPLAFLAVCILCNNGRSILNPSCYESKTSSTIKGYDWQGICKLNTNFNEPRKLSHSRRRYWPFVCLCKIWAKQFLSVLVYPATCIPRPRVFWRWKYRLRATPRQ